MKNIVLYLIGLLVSDKGWFNETKSGWNFRKIDWSQFSLTKLDELIVKLNAKGDDEFKYIYAEGLDVDKRTEEKGQDGKALKTTYLWIGKETAKVQTKEDLFKSMGL